MINAFETPRAPSACLIGESGNQECSGPTECRIRALFDEVDELVRSTFESVTLDTLVR